MVKKMRYLLIFVPISLGFSYFRDGSIWSFITSALAIIPLAALMASITDRLRNILGSSWGGIINVTFGNATELIISIFAIYDGLLNVVKANITGSIIMNLLLVLGMSFLLGGLRYQRQKFDKLLAITNSAMLMLAVIGMLIPAIFYFGSSNIKTLVLGKLSMGVGFVLFVTYLASLYFTLIFHEKEKKVFHVSKGSGGDSARKKEGKGKLWYNVLYLLLTTIFIAIEASILVGSIEIIQEGFNISPVFIGVIILPIISNVAENVTAINMARADKIDLSITIAIGSSIQVSLFIVPLLIFFSHLIGRPMNVLFNLLEISSIGLSVLAINVVYLQGKSNWFEGLQLIAAYLIIAIAFYFA
ncbi:calcium/proton exchanger [Iocasia frigidifontis]|uniref:Ca(2+)/H(+) antiporter n=1 Tax=Iocasia fonsfrigidae TaxID=2682810 RepID=A0A8A7KKU0_9FIRM|nr:calcium/proton exchanger [Iocasia fonsfrigidae]QTL99457.1 calcium/proton exchanger [Iocasia fonsfrigidae]